MALLSLVLALLDPDLALSGLVMALWARFGHLGPKIVLVEPGYNLVGPSLALLKPDSA